MVNIDEKKSLKILLKCFKEAGIPFRQSKDGIARINGLLVDEYFQREELIHKIMHMLYNLIINKEEERYNLYMDNHDFKGIYLKLLENSIIQEIVLHSNPNVYRLSLPYLDMNNDYIDIYIKYDEERNKYILTDDGYTIKEFCNSLDWKDERLLNLHHVIMDENKALNVFCYTSTDIIHGIHLLAMCIMKLGIRHFYEEGELK